jgi:threonine/homoserine/homoserine lactone efflux protein
MKGRLHSYKGYSIGCAVVWAVILIAVAMSKDESLFHTISLVCGGWWLGWLSATIARSIYPVQPDQRSY